MTSENRPRLELSKVLAGAQLAAMSRRARELAEELAQRTEHIDLSTDHLRQRRCHAAEQDSCCR